MNEFLMLKKVLSESLKNTFSPSCTDQLLSNSCLIRLCLACLKHNTAVKAAIDACSLLAKFSDLFGQRLS